MSVPAGVLTAPRLAIVRAARPQLAVMSGQLAAGVGNLLYAVVLARVLDPGDYSQVVAFLAHSNHHHTIVVDTDGRMPEFLEGFHKLLAKHQHALRGRVSVLTQ